MTKPRWLYALAGVAVVVAILIAFVGIKTRYSCGEGWDVSETSRSGAVEYCTAGDVPQNPTIYVDHQIAGRWVVLLIGFVVASIPLRAALSEQRRRQPAASRL